MITKTSLKNPVFLMKVKAAILTAVRNASVSNAGSYAIDVYNNKGRHSMSIIAIAGQGYRINTSLFDDITDMVNEALNEYHANKK